MTARRPEPVGLTARIAALNEEVRAGWAVLARRLYGLPEVPDSDCWADIAGAAALTEVAPKTITGWLIRCGPRRNPSRPLTDSSANCLARAEIAIIPNGKTAYVANAFSDNVTPIRTATDTALKATNVGSFPAAIACSLTCPVDAWAFCRS